MIQHMIRDLVSINRQENPIQKISREEYQAWLAGFTFEGLCGVRYGQSFCNRFSITDNILFYNSDVHDADCYIQENYVK